MSHESKQLNSPLLSSGGTGKHGEKGMCQTIEKTITTAVMAADVVANGWINKG